MKTEIYQWVKNLAVFYILFTALIHLVPDGKYERYVRSFMGLLLIFMMITPIAALLGKSEELLKSFETFYQQETAFLQEQELSNLQEIYLEKGYAGEAEEKIYEELQKAGINPSAVAVHIEGERMSVVLKFSNEPTEEQERRIQNALGTACGIEEGEYQIQVVSDDTTAVDRASSSGTSSGSDRTSHIR